MSVYEDLQKYVDWSAALARTRFIPIPPIPPPTIWQYALNVVAPGRNMTIRLDDRPAAPVAPACFVCRKTGPTVERRCRRVTGDRNEFIDMCTLCYLAQERGMFRHSYGTACPDNVIGYQPELLPPKPMAHVAGMHDDDLVTGRYW